MVLSLALTNAEEDGENDADTVEDDGDDVPVAVLAMAVAAASIDMGALRAALRHGSDAFAFADKSADDDEEEDDEEAEEDAVDKSDRDGAAADFRLP
jgi:hypothetical protein